MAVTCAFSSLINFCKSILFFINNIGPTSGGTAHTICLCERQEVPVFTQRDWLA